MCMTSGELNREQEKKRLVLTKEPFQNEGRCSLWTTEFNEMLHLLSKMLHLFEKLYVKKKMINTLNSSHALLHCLSLWCLRLKHSPNSCQKGAGRADRTGKGAAQKKLIAILSESSAGSNSCTYVTQSCPERRTHSASTQTQCAGFKVGQSFGIFNQEIKAPRWERFRSLISVAFACLTERVSTKTETPNSNFLTCFLPPRSGSRHGQCALPRPSSPAESDTQPGELRADGTGAQPVRMSADPLPWY